MPGEAVFLCSDGASDAILNNGERLGRTLLNATVARHTVSYRTLAMVVHALRRDLLLDQIKLQDDLTMVMLMRHDLQQDIARREVPVSLESLRAAREWPSSWWSGNSVYSIQSVTVTVHRRHFPAPSSIQGKLFAQTADMGIDGARIHIGMDTPDLVEQVVA